MELPIVKARDTHTPLGFVGIFGFTTWLVWRAGWVIPFFSAYSLEFRNKHNCILFHASSFVDSIFFNRGGHIVFSWAYPLATEGEKQTKKRRTERQILRTTTSSLPCDTCSGSSGIKSQVCLRHSLNEFLAERRLVTWTFQFWVQLKTLMREDNEGTATREGKSSHLHGNKKKNLKERSLAALFCLPSPAGYTHSSATYPIAKWPLLLRGSAHNCWLFDVLKYRRNVITTSRKNFRRHTFFESFRLHRKDSIYYAPIRSIQLNVATVASRLVKR